MTIDKNSFSSARNSRAPQNLDITVWLKPYPKLVALEKPHSSSFRRLAQHVLIDLSEVWDCLQSCLHVTSGHSTYGAVVVEDISSNNREGAPVDLNVLTICKDIICVVTGRASSWSMQMEFVRHLNK